MTTSTTAHRRTRRTSKPSYQRLLIPVSNCVNTSSPLPQREFSLPRTMQFFNGEVFGTQQSIVGSLNFRSLPIRQGRSPRGAFRSASGPKRSNSIVLDAAGCHLLELADLAEERCLDWVRWPSGLVLHWPGLKHRRIILFIFRRHCHYPRTPADAEFGAFLSALHRQSFEFHCAEKLKFGVSSCITLINDNFGQWRRRADAPTRAVAAKRKHPRRKDMMLPIISRMLKID